MVRGRLMLQMAVFGLIAAISSLTTIAVQSYLKGQVLAQFGKAWIAFENGDFAKVRNYCDELRVQPNGKPYANLLEGGLLLRVGRHHEALNYFRMVPPFGNWHRQSLMLTGECLYQIGRYPEAEKLFLSLLSNDSNDADAHRWLGAVYFDMGFGRASVEELKRAIECGPRDPRPYRLLAVMHSEFEQFDKAIEYYGKVRQLDQLHYFNESEIATELATALIHLQRHQEAAEILRSLKTPTPSALAALAECEWVSGNKDQAQALLERATNEPIRDHKAMVLLAQIMIEKGDSESAMGLLKEVLDYDAYDPKARYLLATIHQRNGEFAKAAVEMQRHQETLELHTSFVRLQKVLWKNPQDTQSRRELAETASKLGRTQVADFWSRAAQAAQSRSDGNSEANSRTN